MNSLYNTMGTRLFGKNKLSPKFAFLVSLILAVVLLVPQLTMAQSLNGSRVQPGSSPSIMADTWDNLGGGVTGFDAVVKTIVEHNGYVYVGGSFDTAGGVTARNIARYKLTDTQQWEAIGTGTDAGIGTMVNEIVVHNGLIYVGGTFTQMNGQTIGNLAVYDPSGSGSWSSIGTFGHSDPEFINVFALHVFGDDLYVGGEFQTITKGGTELEVQHLARYDITDGIWHRVGTYTQSQPFDLPFMDGTVMAIDGNDTELVFSGMFLGAGDQTVNGIVRYNPAGSGTWTSLSPGVGEDDFPGNATYGDGVLYVAGDFYTGFELTTRIKAYSIQGNTWTSIGSVFNNSVIDLKYHNGALFVTGDFTEVVVVPNIVTSAGIAKYDPVGGSWSTFGSGVTSFEGAFSGAVSLGFAENKLIVGGIATAAGGVPVNNIARWSQVFAGGGGSGAVASFEIKGANGTDIGSQTAGTPFNVRIRALDAQGNVATSFTGTVALTSTGNLTGTPVTSGSFVAGELASQAVTITNTGSFTLSASDGGDPAKTGTSNSFAVGAGAISVANTGSLLSGANLSRVADGTEAATISVQLKDVNGNNISQAGVVVTFATTRGTFNSTTANTNDSGLASVTLTSTTSGSASVTAEITTPATGAVSNGSPVSVTFGAGAVASFEIKGANGTDIGSQIAGTTFNVRIRALDAQGNVVTSFGSTVSLTSTGNLAGAPVTSSSFVAGELASQAVTITNTGTFTLSASDGATPAKTGTSNSFAVGARATKLVFGIEPSNTVVNEIFSTVTVEIHDAEGNIVTNANTTVRLRFGTNPSPGAALSTTDKAAVAGVATFNDTRINKLGKGYTLVASDNIAEEEDTGLVDATSNPFDVTAGPATQIAINAGNNQSATVGTAVATPPSVIVRDVNNNPVEGVSVTFAVATGDGTVDPTMAVTTDENGVAVVTSWTLGTKASTTEGTNTLAATSGTLTDSPLMFAATATAGPDAKLVFNQQPKSTVAGEFIDVMVLIEDQYGNLTGSQAGVYLTIGTNPSGEGILSYEEEVHAYSGVTFRKLSIDKAGEGYTLVASDNSEGPDGTEGIADAISDAFDITAIPATQLAFTTDAQTILNGKTSDVITVQLRDVSGNVTTSNGITTINLSAGPAEVTFRNDTNTEDIISVEIAAGASQASFRATGTIGGVKKLTVTSDDLTSAEQNLTIAPFANGEGTEANPFEITDVNMLQAMKDYLSSHFVLGNDINASATAEWHSGAGFEPVGTDPYTFTGSLDGKGFKITELTINRPSSRNVGLFGFAGNGSKISNVSLEDVSILGESKVGGLVGFMTVGTITNSYSSGLVTGNSDVGGLVGENYGGTITTSYSSGSVTGSGDYVGGLAGRLNTGVIKNSYSSGSVNGSEFVGGLVGSNRGGTITNSYSSGLVTGNSDVGGLVGQNIAGTITNSYSSGSVIGTGGGGGLVGYNLGTITNSFWDRETSGQLGSAGGTVKSTADMKIQSTFTDADWNFTTTWAINPNFNDGYPRLRGFEYTEQPVVSNVAISGELKVDEVLTATYTYSGPDPSVEEGTTYQWFRSNDDSGANKAAINEATTLTYTTTEADKDKHLSVRVTPKTSTSVVGVPVESGYVGPVMEPVVSPFDSGTGTVGDPYFITNLDMLQAMKDYLDKHFVLGNDIDASPTAEWNDDAGFEPVGTESSPFTGTLDGKGFKITGLTINLVGSHYFYVGLFGITGSGSSFSNVSLEEVNIKGGSAVGGLIGYVGGLVGYHHGGPITNSYSSGSVSGSGSVGGLVGYNIDGPITNSYSSGSVTGVTNVGGLVGLNDGSITNSYSSGSVNGSSSVGGLVGQNYGGSITNSYSSGSVIGTTRVGGLVGSNLGSITNSYSSGLVAGSGSNIGGLVGSSARVESITNSYWDTETSGQGSSKGGTDKSTADMKSKSTFEDAGWDFDEIWQIIEGQSYPYLRNPAQDPPPGLSLPEKPVLSEVVETDVFKFSWSGDETASYVFEIDNSQTELAAVGPGATRQTAITFKGTASGNSLELTAGKLTDGTKYFWRVSLPVTVGENIVYVTSEVGEFTPKAVPSVVTVKSPGPDAPNNIPITGINFSWEPDANATKYQVLVYESTNLETPVIDKTLDASGDNTGIQSAQFADATALKYSTEHKWRVIGYNGTKLGKINNFSSFRTINPNVGRLALIRPPSGIVNVNSNFPISPSISFLDSNGNTLTTETATVTVSISGSNARLTDASATTIAGIAVFSNLRINASGTYILTFSATGYTPVSHQVIVQAPATGAPRLVIKNFPSVTTNGAVFSPQPSVQIQDNTGNVFVSGANSSLSVAVSVSPGASIVGTKTVSAIGGVVSFTGFGITGTPGTYTLTFTAPGLTSVTQQITIQAPTTPYMRVINTPGVEVTGVVFSSHPRVGFFDVMGRPIISATNSVTVSLKSGPPGGGLLDGTLIRLSLAGVATFTGIRITGPSGTYTLEFIATGYPTVTQDVRLVASAVLASTMKFSIDLSLSDNEKLVYANTLCNLIELETGKSCRSISEAITKAKTKPQLQGTETSNANEAFLPILWSAPQDPLSEEIPIIHYAIEYREKGKEAWTVFARPESPDTIAVIRGLKTETLYDIRIAAVYEVGVGVFSDPIEVESIDLQTILDFIDEVASQIPTSIETEEIPKEVSLSQNYPNPFNPTTTIRYALPELAEVTLEVYNTLGQRVAVLVQSQQQSAGWHTAQLDAAGWSSGAYIYRLRAGDHVITKKLLLIK